MGRGRPPMTWESKVEEYIRERERVTGSEGVEMVKEACSDKENGDLSAVATPQAGSSLPEQGVVDKIRHL